jgi:hypothetical protein
MFMDNDFPSAVGFLQSYAKGMEDYQQSGDVIPDLRLQNKYAQEFGGPLVQESLISGSPSFDIPPDIDSPIVDRWIKEYNENNPRRYTDTMEDALKRARALRGRLKGV